MTVKILLAGTSLETGAVLRETVSTLKAEVFLATDGGEMLRLGQKHDFALFILDETLPLSDEFPPPPLRAPATSILSIVAHEQQLFTPGPGRHGGYVDSLSQPFTQQLLLGKILTLLHIHSLQQELLSCHFTLEEENDKHQQCQQSLEQQNHYLKILSVRDGLSGLFNRRHLSQVLEQEMYKARTQNTDLGLLLLDIDCFNEINRGLGQIFGDFVINEFAARLTQNSRPGDLCFRFGGGDFVVLLPATDLVAALAHAEILRQACVDKPFTNKSHSRTITISIGVVTVLANCPQNKDAFISMADQAMYQAKSEGRNRVIAYGQKRTIPEPQIDTIALLQETLRRILKKTKDSSLASIQVLAQSVTGSHQDEHVNMATRYINLLCQGLGLPTTIVETFTNGLTLYSCFRLLLYRELLAKKERFNFNDRKLLNDLPYKLADLTQYFDYFANERKMLLCQGERYDGLGYPEGLAGEEIPLTSRIFSIADGLAAMNSDRPHRQRLSPPEILNELLRGAGTQWDPSLVLLILDMIGKQQLLPFDEDQLTHTRLLISQKISQSC